jgi:hypothetical protein
MVQLGFSNITSLSFKGAKSDQKRNFKSLVSSTMSSGWRQIRRLAIDMKCQWTDVEQHMSLANKLEYPSLHHIQETFSMELIKGLKLLKTLIIPDVKWICLKEGCLPMPETLMPRHPKLYGGVFFSSPPRNDRQIILFDHSVT